MTRDARRVLAAQAARAFGYGLGAVLLGSMLHQRRYSSTEAGALLAAVLGGTILASLVVGRWGDAFGRRRCYAVLYGVLAVTGLVFAFANSVWPLVIVSLAGGLSTEVVESGPFTSLEQAMLAGQMQRTELARGFGVYNAVATAAGSIGALAAAGIGVLRRSWSHAPADARFFVLLVPAALAGMVIAGRLSTRVEAPPTTATSTTSIDPSVLGASRPVVVRLAALFALDSFGGGFVVQAFIAFWLAATLRRLARRPRRHVLRRRRAADGVVPRRRAARRAVRSAAHDGVHPSAIEPVARRRGVRAEPAHGDRLAVAARVVLSQMDVPTRQAYVMALVDPPERTAAASVTNTARYLVRPIGPLLAGSVQSVGLGAPFVHRRNDQVDLRPRPVALVPHRAGPRGGPGMIVCLRTVRVPPEHRAGYLAWIADGVRSAKRTASSPNSSSNRHRRWRHRRGHRHLAEPRDPSTPGSPHQSATTARSPHDVTGGYRTCPASQPVPDAVLVQGDHAMKWVTRARPKTDRIACPWLIRRFIDPDAEILYVPDRPSPRHSRTRGRAQLRHARRRRSTTAATSAPSRSSSTTTTSTPTRR